MFNKLIEKCLGGIFRVGKIDWIVHFFPYVTCYILSEWCWLEKQTVLETVVHAAQPAVYLTLYGKFILTRLGQNVLAIWKFNVDLVLIRLWKTG